MYLNINGDFYSMCVVNYEFLGDGTKLSFLPVIQEKPQL